MAVSTTYAINKVINEFTANTRTSDTEINSSVAGLNDGGFIVTYDGTSAGDFVISDQYEANGTHSPGSWQQVNSTQINDQRDSEVAALSNGGYVVVFEDDSAGAADTNIRFRMYDANGVAAGADQRLTDFNGFEDNNPSVDSQLAGTNVGRMVFSWTATNGAERFVYTELRNANGTSVVRNLVSRSGAGEDDAIQSDVAFLADGGWVVFYSSDSDLGAGVNWQTSARIYNANGTARTGILNLDNAGSINLEGDVVGMADGRFAVVYRDNGWGIDDSEITLRIYNANGTASSSFVRVNTTTVNNQFQPKITELSNGFLAVTWTHEFSGTDDDIYGRIFDANGNAVTSQFTIETSGGFQSDSDVAALLNGRFVTTYTDAQTSADDPTGGHIGAELAELVRTSTSDGTGDEINGDSIRDIMNGNGGNDTLRGRGGNDSLFGGDGDDRLAGGGDDDIINGGLGSDRAIFSGTTGAVVNLAIVGPQNTGYGMDTLISIEQVAGTDASDTIFGNAANNRFIGNAGNDFLSGLAGNDVIQGRVGNDTLLGGSDNDKLRGQSGNDILTGGLGKDVYAGGNGLDTFRWVSTADSGVTGGTRDKIKNFDFGQDIINVATIDANTLLLGNQAFVLDTGGAFVAGEIRQIDLGAKTLLQFNTDGDVAPEMEIMVLNNPGVFTNGDFVL